MSDNEMQTLTEEIVIDRLVRCVGIDDLQHVCLPESDHCFCGTPVKRKKLLCDDWKLYWCGSCDVDT